MSKLTLSRKLKTNPTQFRITPNIYELSLDGKTHKNELFSIYNEKDLEDKDLEVHGNIGLYVQDGEIDLYVQGEETDGLTNKPRLYPDELKIFKPKTISYLNNESDFEKLYELRNRGISENFSYLSFIKDSIDKTNYSAKFPVHDYIHETKLELKRMASEYPRKQRIVQNFEWLFDDEYNEYTTDYLGINEGNEVEVDDDGRIYSFGKDNSGNDTGNVPGYLMVEGIEDPYNIEFNMIIRGVPISMRGIIMSKYKLTNKSTNKYNMAFIYPQHLLNNPERVKSIEYIEVISNDDITVRVGTRALEYILDVNNSYENKVNPLNIVEFTHQNRNTNQELKQS